MTPEARGIRIPVGTPLKIVLQTKRVSVSWPFFVCSFLVRFYGFYGFYSIQGGYRLETLYRFYWFYSILASQEGENHHSPSEKRNSPKDKPPNRNQNPIPEGPELSTPSTPSESGAFPSAESR